MRVWTAGDGTRCRRCGAVQSSYARPRFTVSRGRARFFEGYSIVWVGEGSVFGCGMRACGWGMCERTGALGWLGGLGVGWGEPGGVDEGEGKYEDGE